MNAMRMTPPPASSPSIIVARPPSVSIYVAALNRAEDLMEEDTRGCADCDEAAGGKCDRCQATLNDAVLVGKLRDALSRASASEMATVLAWAEVAA